MLLQRLQRGYASVAQKSGGRMGGPGVRMNTVALGWAK
jgi:hypothetical protein